MTPRPKGVFLLEIGTEEIPARMIAAALKDLAHAVFNELEVAALLPPVDRSFEKNTEVFGTPRRLAVRVREVLDRQPDREEVVTGPPVKAAFDASGRPTKAAEGFARAQGVPPSELRRMPTPKGECVGVSRRVEGRSAIEILSTRLPAVLGSLSFPKTMRWGSGEFRFVRPVHWIVAVLDRAIVDFSFAGVRSGNRSTGHRVRGAGAITIPDPMTYVETLREHGVAADIAERRRGIASQLEALAARHQATIAAPPGSRPSAAGDPELLEDVVHSVEWPHVVAGEFDAAFLDLPEEILVTAMRHHQKAFSLRRDTGGLLNRFLAISDTEGDPRQAIRKGNEWVLRARLADARFFWDEDRKTPLVRHAAALERVTFHEKLGTFAAKAARTVVLAREIHGLLERSGLRADAAVVEESARLCKADLTTLMVKEFPELEGIVGGLYARADGLPEGVAEAIDSHYLPRGADDPLPRTIEGAAVSIADRLDTQAGIFLLGVVPTGSRDPYGLRRSVLGVCRVLIERKIGASLAGIVDLALAGYPAKTLEGGLSVAAARTNLLDFYRGRLQFMGEEAGLRQDSVRAALAASADDPYAARLCMEALDAIRDDPGFLPLVLAHKRIKNILKNHADSGYESSGLKEEAERDLEKTLRAVVPAIEAAQARSDPLQALRELARLGPALDRFFAEVMVMTEDKSLRDNRLGLLQSIAGLFLRVGDFSEIVVEGAGAPPEPPRDPAGARAGEARR